ncbi:DNA-binding, RecF, conserved site [Acididesulfobacillus acetoxydans]|uniref:DNA replication and repair protein RecF n=1 Tax=Acididesulfobacillus acetoxydans TaxID=1561005 RepID=A0A8S0WL47_9FIRM|nr:DNA replication/repair protein RecF [Acididesulfobacillus acetoxydans]CAA7599824.1 DNA-binding, RecF, conserved site [Acididesulfobacillus acetoxydans]CEJ07390.1 DNA replication and repair protein RecF [Acididesulfobacillus acetoxydans]
MRINYLALRNFRNYIAVDLEFPPGTSVFAGFNGQGKTNLLEGIYYLLHGRSYREGELIRWGERYFHLEGEFALGERNIHIEAYSQGRRKVMKVNGSPVRKLSEYLGTVNAVSFAPDDLTLVKGGPSERRKFLDQHIAQIQPRHIAILNSYNKALQQKNALLKTNLTLRDKQQQISLWNEQLVNFGCKIIANRMELVEPLAQCTAEIYSEISGRRERFGMLYRSLGKNDAREAIALFPSFLQDKQSEEIERRISFLGPHRDDLYFRLGDKPARLYASQGQQRSIVLSLKLAQMRLIKDLKSEYPLLLLDDVLSELDKERQEFLLSFIRTANIQTLLTMTNGEKFPGNSAVFYVEEGKIRRKV